MSDSNERDNISGKSTFDASYASKSAGRTRRSSARDGTKEHTVTASRSKFCEFFLGKQTKKTKITEIYVTANEGEDDKASSRKVRIGLVLFAAVSVASLIALSGGNCSFHRPSTSSSTASSAPPSATTPATTPAPAPALAPAPPPAPPSAATPAPTSEKSLAPPAAELSPETVAFLNKEGYRNLTNKEFTKASEAFQKMKARAASEADDGGIVDALDGLAQVSEKKKEHAKADEQWDDAVGQARRNGAKLQEGHLLATRAVVAMDRAKDAEKNSQDAKKHAQDATKYSDEASAAYADVERGDQLDEEQKKSIQSGRQKLATVKEWLSRRK